MVKLNIMIDIYVILLIKHQYTLKNPALREYSIIDSLKELNRQLSAENNECIKHLEESFS